MSENFYMVDGTFFEAGETSLTPFDRSFALGDGLFETVKVKGGVPVWLDEHLARMVCSAEYAGIAFDGVRDVPEWCKRLAEKNGLKEGFMRVTLSRGRSATGRFPDAPRTSTVTIICGGYETSDAPLKVEVSPFHVSADDPSLYHKSSSRFLAVTAQRQARARGLDELIFSNSAGNITEGIFSNLFWIEGDTVYTPAVSCGLLPGIVRGKVIDLCRDEGVRVKEGTFSVDRLSSAETIFFTNSLSGLRLCGEWEGKPMRDTPLFHRLQERYERLEREAVASGRG